MEVRKMDNNVYVNYDQNNIEDYLGSAKRAINNVLELVDDGKGLHSKSMSVMMMAFGGAIGSADMLAGINAELHKVDAEKQESIWEEFQDVVVLLQAAAQLIEKKAEKLKMDNVVAFKDSRTEGIDQNIYKGLLAEYNHFKIIE